MSDTLTTLKNQYRSYIKDADGTDYVSESTTSITTPTSFVTYPGNVAIVMNFATAEWNDKASKDYTCPVDRTIQLKDNHGIIYSKLLLSGRPNDRV